MDGAEVVGSEYGVEKQSRGGEYTLLKNLTDF